MDEFREDRGYLYKFVTKPGPFNFVGDENSTPCKSKRRPMSVTPASALGKRKRKHKEEDSAMDFDGTWFSNEHASTSCDEDSFHAIATPVKGRGSSGGPRGPNVRSSGGLRRGSGNSGGVGERQESSKDCNMMLEESPAKRCRKEGGSVSGCGSESFADSSTRKGGAEVDHALLSKVWKELTLNR